MGSGTNAGPGGTGAVLSAAAADVLKKLGRSPLAGEFYLAGGTGLALHLRHRRSDELDFFQATHEPSLKIRRLMRQVDRVFPLGAAKPQVTENTEVTLTAGRTRITFSAYPFRLLEPLVPAADAAGSGALRALTVQDAAGKAALTPPGDLSLASVRDIAAMKAYVLGRRATYRDYVDLYFLLASGLGCLETIVRDASSKFVLEGECLFSTKLFLQQLADASDVQDKGAALDLVMARPGEARLEAAQVEAFLREEARRFLEHWCDGKCVAGGPARRSTGRLPDGCAGEEGEAP